MLNILRPETLYNSIVTISERVPKALQLNQHLLMHKVFGDLEGKWFKQLNYKGNYLIPIIQLFQ